MDHQCRYSSLEVMIHVIKKPDGQIDICLYRSGQLLKKRSQICSEIKTVPWVWYCNVKGTSLKRIEQWISQQTILARRHNPVFSYIETIVVYRNNQSR